MLGTYLESLSRMIRRGDGGRVLHGKGGREYEDLRLSVADVHGMVCRGGTLGKVRGQRNAKGI